jgi:hypothetical protein
MMGIGASIIIERGVLAGQEFVKSRRVSTGSYDAAQKRPRPWHGRFPGWDVGTPVEQ